MYSNILKVFLLSILPIFNIIGESEKKKVLVGKIDNNIDPRTNRYSKLLLICSAKMISPSLNLWGKFWLCAFTEKIKEIKTKGKKLFIFW